MRAYTLVGFASALIMLVSKYGFTNVIAPDRVVLDPSRVAAQIVTGIGFIGGGLIFVRRDSVRGLTTAAIVWLTAAVGMACGAGLPILALVATAFHFVVVFAFPPFMARLPKSRWAPSLLQVSYEDGRKVLREVLVTCTRFDFTVSRLKVNRDEPRELASGSDDELDTSSEFANRRIVTVLLELQGTRSVTKLAAKLATIDGVTSVSANDVNVISD
jgi:putative Mg2+ transporter-C (MgtC) family protein